MTDPSWPDPSWPAPPSPGAPPPAALHAPPPGAYAVPVGGYQAPVGGYAAPATISRPSRATGAVALIIALLVAIVPPVVAGVFAFQIGVQVPADRLAVDEAGLEALIPVRGQVLGAEIAFWTGTVLGILALVLGIVATVRRRGRGMGIAAIIVAALAPGVFLLVVVLCQGLGGVAGYTSF